VTKRIALVTSLPERADGVYTVTNSIRKVLRRGGRCDSDIIYLSTSIRDSASVKLLDPRTWCARPRTCNETIDGILSLHVGAHLTEFESQRYKPRRMLTDSLNQEDQGWVA
jgi:hypothetical protein